MWTILRLSRKKGTEVIVNDYCENTDLDIWVQLLKVKNASISYFPQSLKISDPTNFSILKEVMFDDKVLW